MPFDSEITEKSRDLIVLEKARELIARGWCQRSQRRGESFCMVGALRRVAWRRECAGYTEYADLANLLGFPAGGMAMAMWNDSPGRTQAEVLARFDAAIARLADQ